MAISFAVTSFWKSTNAFGCGSAGSGSADGAISGSPATANAPGWLPPASVPSRRHVARSNIPAQAPTESPCLAARLHQQMHRRRPAAGHQHRIAGNDRLAVRQPDRIHPPPAGGAADGHAGVDRDAQRAHRVHRRAGRLRPQIDDRRDRHPRGVQIRRGAIGAVIRRNDHGAVSHFDTVTVKIRPRRARQHDAGTIVARKNQRALDRAGGQDDAAGADVPQPFPRHARCGLRQMVRQPLRQADQVAGIGAEGGGARQQRDGGAQGRERLPHPVRRRPAVDRHARVRTAANRRTPPVHRTG